MTSNEIIAGNKLIAEFMGLEIKMRISAHGLRIISLTDLIKETDKYESPNYLLFHTSWDWLMPVLEKIEMLGFRTIQHGFLQPYGNGIVMYDMYIKKQSKDFEKDGYIYEYEGNWNTSKIEAAWIACVEIIKFILIKMKKEHNLQEPPKQALNIPAVSGSYIWLVEDCDGSSILSAHLTEEEAEKEREKLRSGYASRVDFRVYSVVIS